ncbi:hypothetical protein QM327_20590 [Pantoea dispersa]|uniref:hypothetical protein n=1 Tax=Pantoea dispersa TaxID=59814 RepID=UPI0024B869EF|nr:hypothetical protein [Pantoea dispersa]MDI9768946.1 hypothetical protein [Pantoea dispersa]
MIKGILIYEQKGDYAIIEANDGFILKVLTSDFYEKHHLDVSKVFLMAIDDLIKEKNFNEIITLTGDIRENYNSYIDKEVRRANVIGKSLIG